MSNSNENAVGAHQEYEAGAPTMETVERFGNTIEKSKKSPYMIVDPVFFDQGNGVSNEQAKARMRAANAGKFPVRPLPADEYDTTWQIKQDMAGDVAIGQGNIIQNQSMVSAKRPLPFTKKDIEYLQRKRDAEENAAYLFWQASKYNLNDPATRDWFQRVCPSYFDQRASLVEEQIDASARYAKIRLRGPKSEDDYKFQWLIETDRLKLPKGPLWDPFEWMVNEAEIPNPATATAHDIKEGIMNYNQNAYRRGLWNPIKVMTPPKGGLVPNPWNIGDISGAVDTHFVGPVGVIPVTDTEGRYNRAYGGSNLTGWRTLTNSSVEGQEIINQNNSRQTTALKSTRVPGYYTQQGGANWNQGARQGIPYPRNPP